MRVLHGTSWTVLNSVVHCLAERQNSVINNVLVASNICRDNKISQQHFHSGLDEEQCSYFFDTATDTVTHLANGKRDGRPNIVLDDVLPSCVLSGVYTTI